MRKHHPKQQPLYLLPTISLTITYQRNFALKQQKNIFKKENFICKSTTFSRNKNIIVNIRIIDLPKCFCMSTTVKSMNFIYTKRSRHTYNEPERNGITKFVMEITIEKRDGQIVYCTRRATKKPATLQKTRATVLHVTRSRASLMPRQK